MSLLVDTHGTGKVEEAKLQKLLPELFPLRPTNIRRTLKLSRPIYRRTAAYGHFGRAPEKDGGFSWSEPTSPTRSNARCAERVLSTPMGRLFGHPNEGMVRMIVPVTQQRRTSAGAISTRPVFTGCCACRGA